MADMPTNAGTIDLDHKRPHSLLKSLIAAAEKTPKPVSDAGIERAKQETHKSGDGAHAHGDRMQAIRREVHSWAKAMGKDISDAEVDQWLAQLRDVETRKNK